MRPGSGPDERRPADGESGGSRGDQQRTRSDASKLTRPAPERNHDAAARPSRYERTASLDVGDVKSATDLASLIGEHVALKMRGRGLIGRCPFHDEKTASFIVHPDRGFFHCFGCNAGGDALTFLQRLTGCSFRQALGELAERAGIQPRRLVPGTIRREINERKRRQQEHQARVAAVRQRWRDAILRHDDLEGLCFALGVAERRDPERRLELTRSLFEQYGWAISLRAKVERELDAIEAEERAVREQPVHAPLRALAGAA